MRPTVKVRAEPESRTVSDLYASYKIRWLDRASSGKELYGNVPGIYKEARDLFLDAGHGLSHLYTGDHFFCKGSRGLECNRRTFVGHQYGPLTSHRALGCIQPASSFDPDGVVGQARGPNRATKQIGSSNNAKPRQSKALELIMSIN